MTHTHRLRDIKLLLNFYRDSERERERKKKKKKRIRKVSVFRVSQKRERERERENGTLLFKFGGRKASRRWGPTEAH